MRDPGRLDHEAVGTRGDQLGVRPESGARHPAPLVADADALDPGTDLLRNAGFSVALAADAFSVLDAYVFGFVLTEVNLPFEPGESAEDFVADLGVVLADHPHLAEMVAEQVVGRDYQYGDEFDYGLELILDGLEARFR